MSAPKGNRFGCKPAALRLSSTVIVRGTAAEYQSWQSAWLNAPTGRSFSQWARTILNAAAAVEWQPDCICIQCGIFGPWRVTATGARCPSCILMDAQ